MGYKWQLRRGGVKEICPNCGQRRFVPYVSSADKKTLAGAEYGRCDREQHCGYHRYPNGVKSDGIEAVQEEDKEPIRFVQAAVKMSLRSTLFGWVASTFGIANAIQAFTDYKVGAQYTDTIFWQISADGSIRGGKVMPYKRDGHRDKESKHPAMWVHAQRWWRQYYTGEELQQCFFGEHLLVGNDKQVAIVESEKTALCMSIISRGWVWLASGGSQGLKREERLRVLQGRRVMLIPDNGQYWNWKEVADKHGWEITDVLEKHPLFDGCDVLDMVVAGCFGKDLTKINYEVQ